jgi:hypothetical protein
MEKKHDAFSKEVEGKPLADSIESSEERSSVPKESKEPAVKCACPPGCIGLPCCT